MSGQRTWDDGCRCSTCRKTHRAAREVANRRKRQESGAAPHGTVNGYVNYACRCEACRAARRAYLEQPWAVNR